MRITPMSPTATNISKIFKIIRLLYPAFGYVCKHIFSHPIEEIINYGKSMFPHAKREAVYLLVSQSKKLMIRERIAAATIKA